MASITVEIDLDDFDDDELIDELKVRGVWMDEFDDVDYKSPDLNNPKDVLIHIKSILGLRCFENADRVKEEIDELFKLI